MNSIIIIPIHHGGHITPNQGLGLLITLNLIFITFAIVRSIIWYYKVKVKKVQYFDSYINYAIMDNKDMGLSFGNALFFLMVNGITLLILITNTVSIWLDKVNPS